MNPNDHKIDANDRTINQVLSERKYTVDYFQREYSWGKKHIEQLITDLTTTFLNAYAEGDLRTEVKGYCNYYLGPFVISGQKAIESIIDGQQRLTSLTLFLIYLNNLQKRIGGNELIAPLIFSEKYGEKSFNIQIEERTKCLSHLFTDGSYTPDENDDESTKNMVNRYLDIEEAFPEELKEEAFPYFLDWLKYNVILVEITAYSDDNAYTIFESMNDRGLNLTPTEMLKGFILSKITQALQRNKANMFWKESIQKLHSYRKDEDQRFLQAWLRSQYADTIRKGEAGSTNEDFEKIGTHFHIWFRDNLQKIGLNEDIPTDFEEVLHERMRFYLQAYYSILEAQKKEVTKLESVFYHSKWGIAESLSLPLMLAPLIPSDSLELTQLKINEVARFMETFAVRRAINFRKFGASSIRYTMYSLVKELRGLDLESLRNLLNKKLTDMPEKWDGISEFRLHRMNRGFVKFLLSRITGFLEQESGSSVNFSTFFVNSGTRPYEVEHIWADKFDEHRDEFEQEHEFDTYRNRIGDLVLLPQGTNQSYGAMPYNEKIQHYLKENIFVKSLHPKCYENNPNFLGLINRLGLPLQPFQQFKKAQIDARQKLIQRICESIWY